MRPRKLWLSTLLLAACTSEPEPAPTLPPVGTCRYETLPPTALAGATVEPGPVQVGTAERDLGLPIGSALGGYTSRVALLGSAGRPDDRLPRYSGAFVPSVGVETRARVKALAITAGDETVLVVHVDVGAMYDGVLFEVERRLGPAFAGKVILAASHTHSGPAHFVGNTVLQLGFGGFRETSFERMVGAVVAASEAALAARQPARIGIAHNGDFDPMNDVSRDRRSSNDDLPGGADRKDHDLFVLRADALDGTPLALVPIFGVHPTVLADTNNVASNDVSGAIEVALEESFDRQVLVMHLQQAAGDVSPAGAGGLDCEGLSPCFDFARSEAIGRRARDAILATWEAAVPAMTDTLAMEMVTRTISLGPDLSAITARQGALSYLPFEEGRMPDGVIFDEAGEVATPIDEFNVAFGAGLCGEEDGGLGAGIPGARELGPYQTCSRVEDVVNLLRLGIGDDWYFEDPLPSCASTRTTLSALRLGEHLLVTLPGEPVNPLVDRMRQAAPVAGDALIVLGYAQDHMGYLLHADDWLRGGYEPSINIWGPIEGEYIAEASLDLARAALSPEREDATTSTGRALPGPFSRDVSPDPSPDAGTVPATLPEALYLRPEVSLDEAQPPATVPRLSLAHFVWIGEDPVAGTPEVTIEREVDGAFEPLKRRSGRAVRDRDVLLLWTPTPLDGPGPRTHHWVAEWQAVPAWGSPADTSLAARAALPLGRYRFHVEGQGYALDSQPFEVVPAVLTVNATLEDGHVVIETALDPRGGFRLLDPVRPSNGLLPLQSGSLSIEVQLDGGGSVETTAEIFEGLARVPWSDAQGTPTEVRVRDGVGNAGQSPVVDP